jgi:hypothetical protein
MPKLSIHLWYFVILTKINKNKIPFKNVVNYLFDYKQKDAKKMTDKTEEAKQKY